MKTIGEMQLIVINHKKGLNLNEFKELLSNNKIPFKETRTDDRVCLTISRELISYDKYVGGFLKPFVENISSRITFHNLVFVSQSIVISGETSLSGSVYPLYDLFEFYLENKNEWVVEKNEKSSCSSSEYANNITIRNLFSDYEMSISEGQNINIKSLWKFN
jgi:hypothetical protein